MGGDIALKLSTTKPAALAPVTDYDSAVCAIVGLHPIPHGLLIDYIIHWDSLYHGTAKIVILRTDFIACL
ncbi:MAG: hypothetical protein J1F14_07960 [Treponema sp.]|nr:hypothetical protein [Treponema sp.]